MKRNNRQRVHGKVDDSVVLMAIKGRDTAVVGLIWQPIHAVRNIAAEAKSLIQNEKCRYFLTHNHGSRAQCGMTRFLPRGKRYWSAVMLLRETLGDSWLGLFRLPGGRFWLAAVDNGMVVPGGDTVFDDEQQAKERYLDYVNLFAWQRKYFDCIPDIEGESIELLPLLSGVELKSCFRIIFSEEIKRQVTLFATRGIFLFGILGALFGGLKYYEHQQEVERLEKLRAEQLARMRASGFAEGAWRNKPPALEMLNACAESINTYPVSIAGWDIVEVKCDGKTVSAIYKAGKNATSKDFIKALDGRKFLFRKAIEAEITEQLLIKGKRQGEKLQNISEISTGILEGFQLGLAKGKMDDVFSNRKKMAKFNLETQLLPRSVFKINNFDGIVINEVTGRVSSQGITWSISGEVYGK
jgi:hypothetical protein